MKSDPKNFFEKIFKIIKPNLFILRLYSEINFKEMLNMTTNKSIFKLTSVLLTLLTVLGALTFAPFAAGAVGNSYSNASAYTVGKTCRGTLREGEEHFYQFTIPMSGKIEIECGTSAEYGITSCVYPQDKSIRVPICSTQKYDFVKKEIIGGRYYLRIENEYQYNSRPADYWFKVTFTASKESFPSTFDKNDNSFDTARAIQTDTDYIGHSSEFDRDDYYSFTLPAAAKVSIRNFLGPAAELKLYKENRERIDSHILVMPDEARSYQLSAGRYYLHYHVYDDGEYRFRVAPDYKATKLALNRGTLGLGVGESYGLVKTVEPKYVPVSWSSSNSSVAYVDKNGKVTGKKAGTATITASAGDKKATCKVTVKSAPKSVSVKPAALKLGAGESYTICENTDSGSYANAANLKWSVSNSSVAEIKKINMTNKAVITAKKPGTVTVTVKTYNGKASSCKLMVYPAPSRVQLSKTSLTLKKGQTYTISENTPSGTYANASNLKWSSSNTKVATVAKGSGNKATIKAVAAGTAYVKINLYNGKTAACKVMVK